MRKTIFQTGREEALALLRDAPFVHLATTTEDGRPILRTVNGVLVDDAIVFHGAKAGEKAEAIGRLATISAEEVVAQVPSYLVDPERACPASTYYRSAHVNGRLETVDAPDAKAHALQALMERFQPEGGHVPLGASHPLYRNALRGVLIVRVGLEEVTGKANLGQHRRPEELVRILAGLWQRGAPGDPRAIDLIGEANPGLPRPAFLASPEGTRLCCAPGATSEDGAVRLLEHVYWNEGIDPAVIRNSLAGSSVWVVAKDRRGAVVATARSLTDGSKIAWVLDVAVAEPWRGRGLGTAVMRLLLDHPRMRQVPQIRLGTRDAQGFYGHLGFTAPTGASRWPRYAQMVLWRETGTPVAP